jgi:hypothetical protein
MSLSSGSARLRGGSNPPRCERDDAYCAMQPVHDGTPDALCLG